MKGFASVLIVLLGAVCASGFRNLLAVTPQTNLLPVNILVNSAPFDVIATPITPVAPYSQAAYQCNVTGDSRFPPFASGTFPLTVRVPVGQRVRVVFANGNLNGATVTQNGEPGVIVQQGGAVIVQQSGSASPIVQNVGSPVVQPTNMPPAAMKPMTGPTVVQQQPAFPQSPVVQQPASPVVQQSSPVVQQSSPVVQQSSPVVQQSTPAATPARTPTPASPIVQQSPPAPAATTPAATPARTPAPASPIVQQSPPAPAATTPAATPARTPAPASPVVQQSPPSSPVVQQSPPSSPVVQQSTPSSPVVQQGRRLLQDRVPGGPNNGLVEYVALNSANTVPGFVVPNTQFGVPYVEFTASSAAVGQTASFKGSLQVAQVVGGVPQYPFTPNKSLSPECQVNVNFVVA